MISHSQNSVASKEKPEADPMPLLNAQFKKLQEDKDLDEKFFLSVAGFCAQLLKEYKFSSANKGIFGFWKSSPENKICKILQYLDANKISLFFDKLKLANTDKKYIDALEKIQQAVEKKNYVLALQQFNIFKQKFSCTAKSALNFLAQWLARRQVLRIESKEFQEYSSRHSALAERGKQKIYDFDELMKFMNYVPNNEVSSFTYAIDLFGNVCFSEGATTSFHVNLCQGAKVFGAGEIYLKKTDQGIELSLLNNKSGLYHPHTEFFKPLVEWFEKQGCIVSNVVLQDERLNLIRDAIQNRMMMHL